MVPQISIIVPIYNAEKLLPRCLNSIQKQIFQNWECILVIDGSLDGSGRICQEFANQDARFVPIFKENGGVSSARNRGLDEAKGDYIAFVDADDHLEKDYLESLSRSDADMVLCGFKSSDGINYNPTPRYYNKKQIGEHLEEILTEYSLFVPWVKLLRRDIIAHNSMRFDKKLRLSEDTMFVHEYLCHCKTLEFLSNASYYYEGKFGGTGKYKLNWDEMEYMHFVHVKKRLSLERVFSCTSSRAYQICPRFNCVPDILKTHTADDCFSVWEKNLPIFKDNSKEYFFTHIFQLGNFLLQKAFTDKSVRDSIQSWKAFIGSNNAFLTSNNFFDSYILKVYRNGHPYFVGVFITFRNTFKLIKSFVRKPK